MEWLFSKEVRGIIAKLRANGELNEIVLQNLKGYFRLYAFQGICFSLFPLLLIPAGMEGSLPWGMSMGIFAFAIVFFLFHIKVLPQKIVPLYYEGCLADGLVTNYYKANRPNFHLNWGLQYEFNVGDKIVNGQLMKMPLHFWGRKYQNGEDISVYFAQSDPLINIPDVQNLRTYFDLRNRRKDENDG